ncbi:MAG: DUF2177 family protein [Hyphomicrobium sp.]|nr:DUF2177 family protein [Hyphomicrobium sp.]
MKLIATYAATLAVFVLVDLIWLGFVAKDFYRASIGHLMGNGFNLPAAFAFYFIYTAGVLFFAVYPAADAGSWTRAAFLGAAFGFFAYATYDLTNMATLKDWPLGITLADMAWGSVLTGIAATAGYAAASRF